MKRREKKGRMTDKKKYVSIRVEKRKKNKKRKRENGVVQRLKLSIRIDEK